MYIMDISDNYPNSYWLSYDGIDNPSSLLFINCGTIDPSKIKKITLTLDKSASVNRFAKYDYIYSSGPDLVSNKFVRAMQKYIDAGEIQVFPATIYSGTLEIYEFSVIHYVNRDNAIHLANSSYEPLLDYMPDGPVNFTHVILSEKKTSLNIFRAAESEGLIIVSEEVKKNLEEEKIKGIKFIKEKVSF